MNEFCAEKGFAGWFETSAKENIGIDEAASFLVNKVGISDLVFIHLAKRGKVKKVVSVLCHNYKN